MNTPQYIATHVFCEKSKKFLCMQRCSEFLNGIWQMVTGKVEPGETPYLAAIRELKEETGITPLRFYDADGVETFLDKRTNKIAFTANFIAFTNEPQITLSPQEHDRFLWLNFDEYMNHLTFSEQKRVASKVYENFIKKTPDEFFRIDLTKVL